jgi:hypothetical protein
MVPNPGVALQDVQFAERPYIAKRDGNFYLHYRLAVENGSSKPFRMVLVGRKGKDKGYYYFSVPISHPEWGNMVERPLALDDFTDFARRNAVYWLNPDGSEIPLEIKQ